MVKVQNFKFYRLCVACRRKFYKGLMLRVSKLRGGVVEFDVYQKKPGRGVYVCSNENCFRILKKKHLIEKNLKCVVDESIYLNLERIIKGSELS